MSSQFNAIDYSQQLQAVGVSQTQADVHAKLLSQALSNCAATRADLAALDEKLTGRIDLIETRLGARMDNFEARMVARMDNFEARMDNFEARMGDFEARMVTRMDTFEVRVVARMEKFEADVRLEVAEMRQEIAIMRSEMNYDRKITHLVLALQIAVIVKLFFP